VWKIISKTLNFQRVETFCGVGIGKAGLSMLTTIGILVVLTMFAGAHRRQAAEDDSGLDASRAGWQADMSGSGAAESYNNPLDPVPKAEWEVLTGCQLVANPTNAADHFRVQRDKPIVFQLYFVDAPELTDPPEDEVAEQSRYFGWSPKWTSEECADRLTALGQQAWQAVEKLLRERPFIVLTKFELRRESHHFYALVVYEDQNGRRRTVQEWLVEQGYATITDSALGWLPTQVASEQFVEQLQRLERIAQQERRGGWGMALTPP
jgi:endonuclease YncB( thermonuclease family)